MKPQTKRLRTLKRHRKQHKRMHQQREQAPSVALVKAEQAPLQTRTGMPSIKETVADMERVRRFIQSSLNVELRKAQEKWRLELNGREPSPEEKKRKDLEFKKLEVDYGTIPGVDKPFLLQPGAEKICFWLKIKPKFHTQRQELGEGHLEVVSHITLHMKAAPHDEVWEGPDASCTSMESNFRFRWAPREGAPREPFPEKEEAAKLKALGLGKWRKVAKWEHNRKVSDDWTWFDRVDNPNVWDERNKIAQIGEKRGFVKGVKNMGALSEIFTTDPAEWKLEDLDEGDPFTDNDYTESGNRIVDDKGFAPSGKPVTHEAKREQTQAVGQARVEELRNKMAEQPKQPQSTPAPAERPVQKPYRERKCVIQRILKDRSFVVRGHIYDDVQMSTFLLDVGAVDAFENGDEKKERPWSRIGEEYEESFVNLCRKLEIKIEWRG